MRRKCCRHSLDYPCTCAMGNVYRFVEPVVLLLLKKKGRSYGYDLGSELEAHAITDGQVERAALYRTLRALELNGNVVSEWDTEHSGPARRVYKLTADGEQHLKDWVAVMDHLSTSMKRFVTDARKAAAADGGSPGNAVISRRKQPATSGKRAPGMNAGVGLKRSKGVN